MPRFISLAITLSFFTSAMAQEYDPSTPEGYREHIRRAYRDYCGDRYRDPPFDINNLIPLDSGYALTLSPPEYRWRQESYGLVLDFAIECSTHTHICDPEARNVDNYGGVADFARDTHTCRELDLPPRSANLMPPAGYSYWGEPPGTFTTPEPTGNLEVPGNGSFQSGIGFMSGWVCDGRNVEIVLNGGAQRLSVSRGVNRGDTRAVCGDTANGFITLWNWNLLGEGQHTAALVVDGQTVQSNTFTITTLGEEFIRGLERDVVVNDFPAPGETTRFRWQEAVQGLVLVPTD